MTTSWGRIQLGKCWRVPVPTLDRLPRGSTPANRAAGPTTPTTPHPLPPFDSGAPARTDDPFVGRGAAPRKALATPGAASGKTRPGAACLGRSRKANDPDASPAS